MRMISISFRRVCPTICQPHAVVGRQQPVISGIAVRRINSPPDCFPIPLIIPVKSVMRSGLRARNTKTVPVKGSLRSSFCTIPAMLLWPLGKSIGRVATINRSLWDDPIIPPPSGHGQQRQCVQPKPLTQTGRDRAIADLSLARCGPLTRQRLPQYQRCEFHRPIRSGKTRYPRLARPTNSKYGTR